MDHRTLAAAAVLCLWTLPAPALGGEEASAGGAPGKLALEPLLVAPKESPRSQLVRLRFEGKAPPPPLEAEIRLPGRQPRKETLRKESSPLGGYTLTVPELDGETELSVRASAGSWNGEASVVLRPLKPWKLFLVQHTHTDIGYTALPSRLNVDHLVFLDEALRACRLTDSYPDDARFRWTCEATWAVRRYLEERPPEVVEEFLERVRQGRIEVTAMRMNMTDLASEELVVRNFLPVKKLRGRGIPVRSAMQCDVNGYPWILPELLEEIGITGLAGGINHTRSTLPFEFPRAISWQSPGGSSVLAWRGEHYMFANMLGFRESVEKVLSRLPGYLNLLEKRGYPYRIALLQMSGYFTDNAAPSHRPSDLAREWQERFATPEIRLATLSEWFDALRREKHAPPFRKAWPDWWADGVGSAPLETAIIRRTQEKLAFAETFLSLARALRADIPDRRQDFHDAYLFASLYDEHTFGAAESVSRPLSVNTKTQWKEKASYSHRARWMATELEDAAFAVWGSRAVARGNVGIVVFNSLPWERDAPVLVEVPRGVAEDDTPFRIVDPETGAEIPYQFAASTRNYREVEMVAKRVPPVGYRVYHLEAGQRAGEHRVPFRVEDSSLSNGLTRVELDPSRAGIAAIQTPPGNENAVDPEREYAFNQYVRERIADGKGRWYLWPAQTYKPEAFERLGATDGRVEKGVSGPVRASLRLLSRVPAPPEEAPAPTEKAPVPPGEVKVESEVSLYRDLGWVFIRNEVESPGTVDPVAGYFSFPAAGTEAPRADVVGGVMVPGRDQIPGSAADWHAIQRWVRVARGDRGITWVTEDVPLVQFGGFNTGRWTKDLSLGEPVFYSWVTNNYWFTNFVASQRGEFVFRYAVSAGQEAASDMAAQRFARGICSPLRGVVAEGRGTKRAPTAASLLRVEPGDIDLVGVKEAEDFPRALVLRLRNRSSKPLVARIALSPPLRPRSAAETTILEEERRKLEIRQGSVATEIAPQRLRTLLVRF